MNHSENKFYNLFKAQQQHQYIVANSGYENRIKKLKRLKKAIEDTYKDEIREVLCDDFEKPELETDFSEIYPVIDEINFAIKNLHKWMHKHKVSTPLALLGSSSYIKYEPKGVCLIISPWNFPFNLTLCPLVSAIAAGNTVIIKPSEMTPNSASLMQYIIKDIFPENEVSLIQGDAEVAKELIRLPFNHIFFTGSPQIGKKVMAAAAENLCSVTLELGGKSPTVIDETANIEKAIKKIAFGKFLNAGQTCIAPDYLLVHESKVQECINYLRLFIYEFYSEDPLFSNSYARIVNEKHVDRLEALLKDSKNNGDSLEIGGVVDKLDSYISPTVISNPSENSKIMQEEIFGPILPIKSYETLKEAVTYINSKPKPLALYIFSKKKKNINYILNNTRAGGGCVNHVLVHYLNHNLPFGGSNNSGIGRSGGFYGFKSFSNSRAILKQHTIGATDFLTPPYTEFKQKLVDFTLKWF